MKVNCNICNKEVNRKPSQVGKNAYCSQECRKSLRITKICPNCKHKILQPPSKIKTYIFCSIACKKSYTKKIKKNACKNCHKTFYNKKKEQVFCSTQCRNKNRSILDHSKDILDDNLIEWIDGFSLGDGYISKNNYFSWCLKHKEFSDYMANIFRPLLPVTRSYTTKEYKYTNINRTIRPKKLFMGSTKSHPDIMIQRRRWYPDGKKIVPKDVNLTSKSVLLWYLGDGLLIKLTKSVCIELCTDGFSKKCIDLLAEKLNKLDIFSSIKKNKKNQYRIIINLNSIRRFFCLIGWESPIKCYDYKFNIPNCFTIYFHVYVNGILITTGCQNFCNR